MNKYVFCALVWVGASFAAVNGKPVLMKLANPIYPKVARTANIAGDVRVLVSVRPDGSIATATIVSGPPMLQQSALESAQHSTFECNGCTGDARYLILYKFKQASGDDCCTAHTVVPAVRQEPVSADNQETPDAQVEVVAERVCICDPAPTIAFRRRSVRCLYLWKCSVR